MRRRCGGTPHCPHLSASSSKWRSSGNRLPGHLAVGRRGLDVLMVEGVVQRFNVSTHSPLAERPVRADVKISVEHGRGVNLLGCFGTQPPRCCEQQCLKFHTAGGWGVHTKAHGARLCHSCHGQAFNFGTHRQVSFLESSAPSVILCLGHFRLEDKDTDLGPFLHRSVCVCVYVYIYIYIYIRTYTHTYLRTIRIYRHVGLDTYTYDCSYLPIYLLTYLFIYPSIYLSTGGAGGRERGREGGRPK